MKIITSNRKASFEYNIISKYESGIVLKGSEVKAIRAGNTNLNGSFAKVINGEIILFDMHVGVVPNQNNQHTLGLRKQSESNHERKLLLHKKEIEKISKLVDRQGMTLIPLSLYFNDRGILKVELGVCEGKKLHDKKQALKEKDLDRDMKRSLK